MKRKATQKNEILKTDQKKVTTVAIYDHKTQQKKKIIFLNAHTKKVRRRNARKPKRRKKKYDRIMLLIS